MTIREEFIETILEFCGDDVADMLRERRIADLPTDAVVERLEDYAEKIADSYTENEMREKLAEWNQ